MYCKLKRNQRACQTSDGKNTKRVLNRQMKAIQKELGKDSEDAGDDINELENKLENLKLPKDVREKAKSEFKKLKQMSQCPPKLPSSEIT